MTGVLVWIAAIAATSLLLAWRVRRRLIEDAETVEFIIAMRSVVIVERLIDLQALLDIEARARARQSALRERLAWHAAYRASLRDPRTAPLSAMVVPR